MESEFKSVELHDALFDFTELFISSLWEVFKDKETLKRYFIGTDKQTTAFKVYDAIDVVSDHPLIKKMGEAIDDNNVIKKHFTNSVGTQYYSEPAFERLEFLAYFVATYLDLNPNFTFEERMFNQLYHPTEEYFYKKSIEHRIIAPIGNFSCSKSIDFGNGLKIDKIPREIHDKQYKNAIIFAYSSKKVFRPVSQLPQEDLTRTPLRDVILALRLFKPNLVYYNSVFFDAISPFYVNQEIKYNRRFVIPSNRASYILRKTEIDKLKNMWSDLENSKNKIIKIRGIPVQRFGQAIERVTAEDQLLDYTIGLESLLSKGNEGEMTFKIAMRGAIILGSGPKSRNKIFKDLRDIYSMRSRIVHGTAKIEEKKLDDLIMKSASYLKNLITIFLDKNEQPLNEYLDNIDKTVFL